ncbi:MAG: glycerophosphoryl diester phosphodiesterase membrane domain-containing protein, partial [Microbacterium sp.]
MSQPRTHVWATTRDLLTTGVRVLRRGGPALALLYVLSQAAITLAAMPVLGWLVREALAAAGLVGIDMPQLGRVFASPVSIGLFLLVLVLGYLLVLGQLLLLLVAVRRTLAGEELHLPAVINDVTLLFRRLLHPSSLGLAPYLLLLLPLAGFGFFSVLTRTIAVPSFITGELTKTVPGTIGYVVFLLVIGFLCERFALTLPLFSVAEISGAAAVRLSWRLTRRNQSALALAIVAIAITGMVAGFLLLLTSIAPTLLTDALWPAASPAVAAIMLALAVTAGILIMGAAVVMVAAVLLRSLELTLDADPEIVVAHRVVPSSPSPRRTTRGRKRRAVLAGTVLVALAAGAGALTSPFIFEMSRQPSSLVLAHRGFSSLGVENTISALDGARSVGSDLVEMDVMQTADEGFVVLHDSNLSRLADRDVHIADLTLAEATGITVKDLTGNHDLIPSL